MSISTNKRRRSVITLETKMEIIKASTGKSSNYLSKKFNLESRTIRRILQKKEKIIKEILKNKSTKRACLQPIKYKNIDREVYNWIKLMSNKNTQINGKMLKV
jgi:hypothetical protein